MVAGSNAIEDNVVTADNDYARHTLNLNTGSIGVACCGMMGSQEEPFRPGPAPITEKQWRTMCIMVADLCRVYGIPITPETVLTHAEVWPTLGVRQNGKWDFTRLPHRPDLRGSKAIGDYMRMMGQEVADRIDPPPLANTNRPILRRGMPYGERYDHNDPAHRNDGVKRGLLGNFFCSSLAAQFEGIMYDWINLGLQNASLTRTNDPIIGANDPATSRFDIPRAKGSVVTLKGFPRFTHTEAGLYLFFPSTPAIRYLSSLK
jgi:hypothetical protein